MPVIFVKDGEGNTIRTHEFNGVNYPPVPGIDANLKALPDLPARDDDTILMAYPKSGTHWIWEIAQLLLNGKAELTQSGKMAALIDFIPPDEVKKMPSPRLLNSHVQPSFYPRDLIKRKCKIIYVMRNPKDVYVSHFHHKSVTVGNAYDGTWSGYFSLVVNGQTDYGSWYDFTKLWEAFFLQHPDVPVLTLLFEDLIKDMASGVQKLADFLNVPCSRELRDGIIRACTFSNMKAVRDATAGDNAATKGLFKDDKYPLFRKGTIGDWKTLFTVAQNERFNEEYTKRMKGSSFAFEQYM